MRNQNWEKRLAEYIHGEKEKPFVWGENDCIAFAAKGANEVLSKDLMPEFKSYGAYDKAQADALIEQHGSLEAFFDRHFRRRVNMGFLQRGDICVVEILGQKAAGIVDTSGMRVACKTEKGLVFVPVKRVTAAWDIEQCPR